MPELIKVAFASGTDELNAILVERIREAFPALPLYVVSEFPPAAGIWIPYHPRRGFAENLARCRAAIAGKRIRLAGMLLVPGAPYRPLRLMALLLAPLRVILFNENLDTFMLRPRQLPNIARHLLRGLRNVARSGSWKVSLAYAWASLAGWMACARRMGSEESTASDRPVAAAGPYGISVVIPSRNGRELLEAQLPGLMRQLEGIPSEIVVVDNGSDDATTAFLEPRGILVEHSVEPLSFAAAVNRGIRRAAYSHVLLLNNDMLLEPGFFAPLLSAFGQAPNLFCATAQILFPPGVRREETGKAVMRQEQPADFPVHCLDPLPGEDLSYVFYGSGGCSLFDTAKLRALGCVSEAFVPAYVEDLDLGYRGWQRGWPTVFVAAAKVVHKHRATTSRYYTEQELERVLELNYLRFLSTAVADARVFRRLWRQAIYRLHIRACLGHPEAQQALARAGGIALTAASPPTPVYSEEHFLALGTGDVAVFPGDLQPRQKPVVLVASPWAPDPWAQDGAARVYHLMRRAARDYDQVLVAFQSSLATPSSELLAICNEVVFVARPSGNPHNEQYDSLAFRAALEQTVRKWRPAIAQLEQAQMAHYADACGHARKVLVEHELQIGSARRDVDRVVTTSVKEGGRRAVVIPNGVDPDHFQPSSDKPESRRLLWIGSFQQVTNIEALNLFLREVWPLMQDLNPRLHVIAGDRHEFFLRLYESRVTLPELPAGVEMQGFVGDLRPAYSRAEVVIAGTSIRILEAMAMAKAVVTTPAGIGGLDLRNGHDLLVTSNTAGMARAIGELITNPALRGRLEQTARHTAARNWNWDQSAARQRALYQAMMPDSL